GAVDGESGPAGESRFAVVGAPAGGGGAFVQGLGADHDLELVGVVFLGDEEDEVVGLEDAGGAGDGQPTGVSEVVGAGGELVGQGGGLGVGAEVGRAVHGGLLRGARPKTTAGPTKVGPGQVGGLSC